MLSFILWLFSTTGEKREKEKNAHRVLHDVIFFVLIFVLAILISLWISKYFPAGNDSSIPVFILAVTLIARFTQGYIYGVVASVFGVFCVNYMFTYPYWKFTLSISGYPLTFAAMLAVSVLISTLTTRIKHQEKIRLQAETEKMRANLLRSVSHDLRTPLTSIEGLSSVLLEDADMPVQQRTDLLREINKDARWLTRVMENILSVTRITNQTVSLNRDPEVIEEIVSGAILKFRKNHTRTKISVHKPEEILFACVDATLIEQVLVNLLDNSIEHGKTTTEIDVTIADEGSFIRITIADNGCGIAPAVLPHLFDGTASLHSAQSDDHRNMGIGLSVCKSIIEAHGGVIRAHNYSSGGASIEFTLPAKEESPNE